MDKIASALVAAGCFFAGLLEPVARVISRYPKGALIVWAISLALSAWLF